MLLFLLRCCFWLALVAVALPWFVADKSPTAESAVATRSPAAKPRAVARAADPRYFDDTTGSLETSAACGRDIAACAENAAKVDLIALQLDGGDHAPRKAVPSRLASVAPAAAHAPGRLASAAPAGHPPARHVARRPSSIGDLLAR